MVSIGTRVPKAKLFHFENYWMNFPDFILVVQLHWDTAPVFANAAKTVNANFRQVRAGLKIWSKELSNLGKLINNSHFVLAILDGLEEQRILCNLESSFRRLVKQYLAKLLEAKRVY
jgi:hypothetical protein